MNLHGRGGTGVQAGARQALPWGCLAGESAQAEGLAGYQVIPEDLGCELLERLSGTCKNDGFMWLKLILIPNENRNTSNSNPCTYRIGGQWPLP